MFSPIGPSAKNKGGGKGAKSGRVKLPDVFQAQMTGQQNNKKKAGNAASDKQARLKKKRELKSISLDPPVSRYSQWTQKALLTVTDVAVSLSLDRIVIGRHVAQSVERRTLGVGVRGLKPALGTGGGV